MKYWFEQYRVRSMYWHTLVAVIGREEEGAVGGLVGKGYLKEISSSGGKIVSIFYSM